MRQSDGLLMLRSDQQIELHLAAKCFVPIRLGGPGVSWIATRIATAPNSWVFAPVPTYTEYRVELRTQNIGE